MKYDFCPNCRIGLNSHEMALRMCQNCGHDWSEEDQYEQSHHCDGCMEDTCADFGCAVKLGLEHTNILENL